MGRKGERLCIYFTSPDEIKSAIKKSAAILGRDDARPIDIADQKNVIAPLVSEILEGRKRRALANAMGFNADKDVRSCEERVSRWLNGKRQMSADDLSELFSALFVLCDGNTHKEDSVFLALESLFPDSPDVIVPRLRSVCESRIRAIVQNLSDNSLATLLDVAVALEKADSMDFVSINPLENVAPSHHLRLYSEKLRNERIVEKLSRLPD